MGSNNLGNIQQPKGPATGGLSDFECTSTQCQGSTSRNQAVLSLNVQVAVMLRQLRKPQTTETREVWEGSGRLHSMGKNSAQENAHFQKSHSCHGTQVHVGGLHCGSPLRPSQWKQAPTSFSVKLCVPINYIFWLPRDSILFSLRFYKSRKNNGPISFRLEACLTRFPCHHASILWWMEICCERRIRKTFRGGLKDLGEVHLFHRPGCAWERWACPEPAVPQLSISDKKTHVLMLPSVCVKLKKDDAFVLWYIVSSW